MTLKIGDVFTIGNEDAPPWTQGHWEVVRVLEGKTRCRRQEDGHIGWLEQ